jgi:hypothetical protein
MIQIFLKTTHGNTIVLDIDELATINELKETAYQRTKVPTRFQNLINNGKLLLDSNTLQFYNITDSDTIYMNLRINNIKALSSDSILRKRKTPE